MIKKILFILLFPIICFGQHEEDSTTVANSKLIEIAKDIKQKRDSLNNYILLTAAQEKQIVDQKNYIRQDSLEITLLNMTVKSQENIIKMCTDANKPKWYESKIIYYALGVLTTYGAAQLVSTIR